ncbi:MAG: PAS domain S-box protein [Burkholderiales bacterium]
MVPALPIESGSEHPGKPSATRSPWVLYGAGLALVLGLLFLLLAWTHHLRDQETRILVESEASILATRLESTLRRVHAISDELTARLAQSEWPSPRSANGVIAPNAELVAMRQYFPEIASISVFRPDGLIAMGSDPRPANLSAASRAFFEDAKAMKVSELRFSEPVTSVVTGKGNVFAYQPVLSRSGEFLGVVSVPMDLDYFAELFREVRTGEGGVVALRRSEDGRVVLRYPPAPGAVNKAQADLVSLHALSAGSAGGTDHFASPIDGVSRIVGFRRVPGYPFYVVVGRSAATVFAPWTIAALIVSGVTLLALTGIALLLRARARADVERRAADVRYRDIVEAQGDPICRYLPDSTLTFVNATYRRFFQREGEELLGRKWRVWLPAPMQDELTAKLAENGAAGKPTVMEMWERCADGVTRCIQWVGIPRKDASGTVVEFQGVGRDVTAERRATERLQMAMAVAKQGWFDLDVERLTVVEDPAWRQYLGHAGSDLATSFADWLDDVHPDDRDAWVKALTRADQEDVLPNFDFRRRDAQGTYRWMMASGAVRERTAQGTARSIVGIATDITDRKQSEALLRESEVVFRTLANSGPALIWLSGPDGKQVMHNQRAQEYFGMTEQQLIDGAWRERLHAEDYPRLMSAYQAAVAERRPFSIEVQVRRADGEWRWLRTDAMPRKDVDGGFAGYVGFSFDISDAKRLAQELQSYQRHLESLVAARTRELEAAKERAEAANVAKSAFLANMSHEIRTPLNAIMGMAYLIGRKGVPPDQEERLSRIVVAGKHLLGIIDSILELSKIEAGKFDLNDTELDLVSVVEEVLAMTRERAAAKHLRLSVAELPARRHFVGDATRLQQALLNYVFNAIKFTEAGTVTIRVDVLAGESDSTMVRFSVADTGVGIAEEDAARLFQTFEQVDNSNTRKHGGTGLGLAITKRLAELMGGTAGVESTLGVGSTFWFTVRLKERDASSLERSALSEGDAPGRAYLPYQGRRVLLVEDDEMNRDVGRALVQMQGMSCDVAEDGSVAVAMVERERYDVILMDVRMPTMDGLEATRRIRKLENGHSVPIVAVTANVFSDDRAACLAAGMNAFLSKPIDPDKLAQIVASCVEGHLPATPSPSDSDRDS